MLMPVYQCICVCVSVFASWAKIMYVVVTTFFKHVELCFKSECNMIQQWASKSSVLISISSMAIQWSMRRLHIDLATNSIQHIDRHIDRRGPLCTE